MNVTMKNYMPAVNEHLEKDIALRELYAFDLNGYLVVEDAIDPEVLEALTRKVDEIEKEIGMTVNGIPSGDDKPNAKNYRRNNIIFEDPAFLAAAMSPKVLAKIANFIKYPKMKSTWLDFKAQGGGIGFHSNHTPYTPVDAYLCHNYQIHCNLVTVCYALCDIPLDGAALTVIPGSHKSNFPLPTDEEQKAFQIQVPMKKGSALIFTHDMNHGSFNELPYTRRTMFTSFSTGFSAHTLGDDTLYDSLFEQAPDNTWEKYFLRRPKGDRDTYPQPHHRITEEPGLGQLRK
ncbi:phytanoyl-CoA dioxygenase family protein [Paenibacillus qinlingensis]|uniref:Ectoine hydroxylase-related dioxygenase (Phytanoyl-CoA dioxygenase family) n=1 Tax=Paenibacillus qinlingensis TaxID=1837343 RepID=A0ABU1NVF4_9BACL|nr:phytanoyl-CoA dioxygenase family protein [Paenibacillus qinlingensis]MDR6550837.1 ectoine hydroxylase-related dioxygenase (phytanoyl-CoA dioxygenase family) [Paenibacillus qinlingensis]